MPSDEEGTQRAGSRRAMTGLTEAECMALLPHVEPALVAYLQDRPSEGQPCTSRRYTTDDTCPLPTTADQRLFILTYVTQHPIQEAHGQLVGMSPSPANPWIHRRPPVVKQAWSDHELLPARTADDVAALLTTPPTEAAAPSSLFSMMGPNDPSSVRKTRRSRKRMSVASSNATRATTAS